MTQPLNLCRQFIKKYSHLLSLDTVTATGANGMKMDVPLKHTVDLIGLSQKILLPPYGELMFDAELRALDDTEPLKLPYPVTVLEYLCPAKQGEVAPASNYARVSKTILVARERNIEDTTAHIVLTPIICYEHDGTWAILPELAVPLVGYLDRTVSKGVGVHYAVDLRVFDMRQDFIGEVTALLNTLNALACTNVKIAPLLQAKAKRAIKTAIPFDEYHVLTIAVPTRTDATRNGSHIGRHPREHLRRGHIRRYETGTKVWVNACVVAAGAAGKITKDYALRRAA